jgi:hypothetical protein
MRILKNLILTAISFSLICAGIAYIPYSAALLLELCFFEPSIEPVPFMAYWTIGLVLITFSTIIIWTVVSIYGWIEDQ